MNDRFFYVVGFRSFSLNKISVKGLCPNLTYAEKIRNVCFPGSDIFLVSDSDLIISVKGFEIPFFSKKIK